MKILHLANVGQLTGGTGACVESIIRTLPEVDHSVVFRGGSGAVFPLLQIPNCRGVSVGLDTTEEFLSIHRPDVVLLHNIGPANIPAAVREIPSIFYYHSRGPSRAAGAMCSREIVVSQYLGKDLKLPDESVLYQPCWLPEIPERKSGGAVMRIGRIATAGDKKWNLSQMVPLYRSIHQDLRDVVFDLVGCSAKFAREFEENMPSAAQVRWFAASTDARERYFRWDVLLSNHSGMETYGRTCSEAQLAGCVPILPPLGGYLEQIQTRATGWLCGTSREFLEAVKEVARRKTTEEIHSLRQRCRESARNRNDQFRERFLRMAAEVING